MSNKQASSFKAGAASAVPLGLGDGVPERVLEGLLDGATFKDMYAISDDTMEAIYAQAYELYQSGRLDDAESLFRCLCVYDFYNVDYAIGLGAVLQLKGQYETALDVYGLAYTISGGDAGVLLYAGQCSLRLRRWVKARKCFEAILEHTSAPERLLGRARAYLDAMALSPEGRDGGLEEQVYPDGQFFGEKT